MAPKISVIMGAYNCAGTLPAAIASIQNQTFSDWELIICDDGSSDNTWHIANAFRENDGRLILLRNEGNLGLNVTLNRCLAVAHGQYIARMDGDDICAPERFEKELLLYSEHPEAGVVSCSMDFFDDDGVFGNLIYSAAPQPTDLLRGSQFCHAGALMRRDVLVALGGYSENRDTLRVEDFDLWVRMYAAGYRGFNTREILYSMRDDRHAISRRTLQNRIHESKVILRAGKAFHCGIGAWLYAALPIVKSLCPQFVYKIVHKYRLNHI